MNKVAFDEFDRAGFKKKLVVSYEDLVMNQKGTLAAIFEALELRPEYEKVAKEIAEKATVLVNTTTKGNPLEKWEKQLSAQEIAAIDDVVANHSQEYAYIKSSLERLKIQPK